MEEWVAVLDASGQDTGKTILKSEAHAKGIFHPTIHVWCYTIDGRVLLQQRGAQKETYPLKWDVSVAGHISAGESPEVGAVREVAEEIGATIISEKLEKIGVFKTEKRYAATFWDREFTHTYLYLLDANTPLVKQASEVEALEWVLLEDFEIQIQEQLSKFVPNATDRYRYIIHEIRLRLQGS